LPLLPFRSLLKLERRVSHEGMVSVGGNLYGVPDATRKRIVEVHTLAKEVQIFAAGSLIATPQSVWRAQITAVEGFFAKFTNRRLKRGVF